MRPRGSEWMRAGSGKRQNEKTIRILGASSPITLLHLHNSRRGWPGFRQSMKTGLRMKMPVSREAAGVPAGARRWQIARALVVAHGAKAAPVAAVTAKALLAAGDLAAARFWQDVEAAAARVFAGHDR